MRNSTLELIGLLMIWFVGVLIFVPELFELFLLIPWGKLLLGAYVFAVGIKLLYMLGESEPTNPRYDPTSPEHYQ